MDKLDRLCEEFQSTLPVRGATEKSSLIVADIRISIHAPREGSDYPRGRSAAGSDISIHAPREGSDWQISFSVIFMSNFNPRSP